VYSTLLFSPATQTCCSEGENGLEFFDYVLIGLESQLLALGIGLESQRKHESIQENYERNFDNPKSDQQGNSLPYT
jgi:hypothetical protein